MASRNLTNKSIERIARPKTGRTEISDIQKGLFLFLNRTGIRSWVVAYRVKGAGSGGKAGSRVKHTIGTFPTMTIEQARQEAQRINELAASGRDPKLEQDRSAQDREQNSVAAVSAAWLRAMAEGKIVGVRKRPASANTQRNREAILRLHVLPRLGHMTMDEVSPTVLGKVLQAIDDAGGPVDGVLKTVNGLWTFAEGRGLVDGVRPSARFRPRQAKQTEPRALSDDELRSIWRAAERIGHPMGSIVQLLMLTGQRRSEIGHAEWSWLDAERGILTIPQANVKNRAGDHEVVLAPASLAILERTRAIHDALSPPVTLCVHFD